MKIYNCKYEGNNLLVCDSNCTKGYGDGHNLFSFSPTSPKHIQDKCVTITLKNLDPSDTFNITNNSKDEHVYVEVDSELPIINFINNGKGMSCKIIAQEPNEKYKNVSKWNVSGLTNMHYMFHECYRFKQPLDSWDVSRVRIMSAMFYRCSEDRPKNDWEEYDTCYYK